MPPTKIPALPFTVLNRFFSKASPINAHCSAFSVKALAGGKSMPSPGFTVTVITGKKNISKHAVVRNRASRRLKAAITGIFLAKAPAGYHYIFHSQPPVVNLPFSTIQKNITRALDRLNKKMASSPTSAQDSHNKKAQN